MILEEFINQYRDSEVSVYLVSGIQLRGKIVDIDEEAILLLSQGNHVPVMKTSIASIVP